MRFVYGKQDWATRERGQENVYLLTNGLGGFSCAAMINSNTRSDHALLMASLRAPNLRYNLVNRLEEVLETDTRAECAKEGSALHPKQPAERRNTRRVYLSSQEFTDAERNENGYLYLNGFVYEDYPEWTFLAGGVEVVKRIAMAQGKNLAAVEYRISNRTDTAASLAVTPHLQFVPKGQPLTGGPEFTIKRVGTVREDAGPSAAASGTEVSDGKGDGRKLSAAASGAEVSDGKGDGRKLSAAVSGAAMSDGKGGGKKLSAAASGAEVSGEKGDGRKPSAAVSGTEVSDGAGGGGELSAAGLEGCPAVYEIASRGIRLYFQTNGEVEVFAPRFCDGAYYAYDARDGRDSVGRTCVLHRIRKRVPAHTSGVLEILYHTGEEIPPSAEAVFDGAVKYRRQLRAEAERNGLRSRAALQLAVSADQFISERESTGGKTILAGYPFFEDWGRDTMVALEGCCMATGQYAAAKSILRTFASYCWKGLVPNLFPEGGVQPRYNTADASLLFINSIYRYVTRTGDLGFAREMWPVMTQIIMAYRDGTDYGIGMEKDGLIRAGLEYDQVTWMDVRIDDYLPTPRHGKPVEINAYWYNALKVMEWLGRELSHGAKPGICAEEAAGRAGKERRAKGTGTGKAGEEPRSEEAAAGGYAFGSFCGRLSERVQKSFRSEFWMEEKGFLKDVLSGTKADEQFRCNQIWAVSMPFSMLDRKQELRIVDAVYEKLYTPYGLRTLSADDAEFRGTYGGEMRARDLAYHQGTVWVFPLGAYYLAYLKTRDYAPEAVRTVKRQLEPLESAMREGCIGQLPEIYDGERPSFSRGCFAQAWSVGEMLRVYEAIENHDGFRAGRDARREGNPEIDGCE